jgi:hypothetical protein
MVSVKDPETGEWTQVTRELHGPTAVITTTTKIWLDYELETRLLEVLSDDSADQTRSILLIQATRDTTDKAEIDFAPWHAYHRWLELGPNRVDIGDLGQVLANELDTRPVRLRRDFKRLLGAIRVNALLNQKHREKAADGDLRATIDDYAAVYDILEPTFAKSVGKKTPEHIIRLVDWISAGITRTGIGVYMEVSTHEIAEAMQVSPSTAHRHVGMAIDGGYLENLQIRKRARMQLALGKVQVDRGGALPTPEKLKALVEQAAQTKDKQTA